MSPALYIAFSIAMLEAKACPKPIPVAKLEKMCAYSVAKVKPMTAQEAQGIGRHAAGYACRKKTKGGA